MQDKARGVGFDWDKKEQVWDKVREEFSELEAEIEAWMPTEWKLNWRPLFQPD
jgi:XTP/dITP diphosphohydrolase